MAAGDAGSPKRYYSATAVETTLSSAIPSASQGDSYTSFVVASTSGFAASFPYTLLVNPDTNKEEVITVTAGTGTTLTVTRGQDGTQAVAHSAGATVRHAVSAREFRELQTHIASRGYDADSAIMTNIETHVHGLGSGDGSVVGTAKAQTLTNKTLSGTVTSSAATFTGGTFSSGTITSATITSATITSSTIRSTTFTSGTVTSSTIASGTLGTDLAAGGYKVTGLGTPSANSDAATKSYVDTQVANLVDSAPGTLDTLNELAAALGDDPNYATTMTNALAAKLSLSGGTMTGAIAMGSNKITGLGTPTASTDATTKAYIDDVFGSATSAASSATAAASSATAAASSATNAATSATSAANSATAAATSATSAADSASAAVTSATSASNSATAAATSATSAATSATNSANSATAAATSATSAATSATNSANSASAASASANTANDWATLTSGPVAGGEYSAKYHAQAAATSATSAATSATSAANSATAAASSATAAAASYDSFDDRYLGSKTTAPTLDNDGNTLVTGAIYFNSVTGIMSVWSGSAWIEINSASAYSAPTLGSTLISSGTTITTLEGFTKLVSATYASLDANSKEIDNTLMGIMGAY
jgi:hypothetical protein